MTTNVTVTYDGGIQPALDREILACADHFGASHGGSGSLMFGPLTRDHEFEVGDDQVEPMAAALRNLAPIARDFQVTCRPQE